MEFWTPFLTGGATRADAITRLDPMFRDSLQAMLMAAPEDIRSGIQLLSAYRSPELQAQLYANALERYGSEAAARRMVAPPGNSRHNYGLAVDFSWGSPEAQAWVHQNASNYGLHFPMSWENWHIEPIGPDGGRVPIGAGGWAGPPGGLPANPASAPAGVDPMAAMLAEEATLAALLADRQMMDPLAGRVPGGGYSSGRSGQSPRQQEEPTPFDRRPSQAEQAAAVNREAAMFPALLDEMQMNMTSVQDRARRMLV